MIFLAFFDINIPFNQYRIKPVYLYWFIICRIFLGQKIWLEYFIEFLKKQLIKYLIFILNSVFIFSSSFCSDAIVCDEHLKPIHPDSHFKAAVFIGLIEYVTKFKIYQTSRLNKFKIA